MWVKGRAKELRRSVPSIKIIYLSAYLASREVAVRAGLEDAQFLSKFDVDTPRLRTVIRDTLGIPEEIAGKARQFEAISTFVNRSLHGVVGRIHAARSLAEVAESTPINQRIAELLGGVLLSLRTVMKDLVLERFRTKIGKLGRIDIAEVLADCMTSSRQLHENAEVAFSRPESALMLTGDRSALEAAFGSLIDNALEAGAGDTHVEVVVKVGLERREKDYVRVSVLDKGTGIPEDILDRLYLPGTTTKGGSGMGFFLASKTIEFHGGWIEIDSPFGEWATQVAVFLPVETVVTKVKREVGH